MAYYSTTVEWSWLTFAQFRTKGWSAQGVNATPHVRAGMVALLEGGVIEARKVQTAT
jgi:hypothetical protein